MHLNKHSLAISAALLSASSAFATLVVEESFDYATEDLGATSSNTLNGGTGFSDDGTDRFWTPSSTLQTPTVFQAW